jgi:hypothetical protein
LPLRDGLIAAALFLGLCGFTQFFAIDPLALCWIALCWCVLPHCVPFAVLVLIAPVVNEKIVIVLGLALTARCVLDREARVALWAQYLAVLVAACTYIIMLRGIALPGNAYQLHPGGYFNTFASNVHTSLSPRGLALNVLPAVVVSGVALLAWRGRRLVSQTCFHAADLVTLPGLALVGLTLTETLQLGRILAHAAPLLAVPAAAWLGRRMESFV